MRKHIFMTLAQAHLTDKTPKNDSQNDGDDIPTFRDFLEYILVTNETGYIWLLWLILCAVALL